MRQLDDAGARFIANEEGGPYLTPYNDPVGHATIGFGHLIHYGPVTDKDRRDWAGFTADQAWALLYEDVNVKYGAAVNALIKVPLNQNQWNALASFTLNNGVEGLKGSTLRRRLNLGDYASVPEELKRWVYAGKPPRILQGLVNRRAREADLFTRAVVVKPTPAPRKETVYGFSLLNINSGKVVDLAGHPTEAKAGWSLGQSRADSGIDQIFGWHDRQSDDSVAIRHAQSGLVLDIEHGGGGDRIVLWDYHGGNNQRWYVRGVEPRGWLIQSKRDGRLLTIRDDSRDFDAPLSVVQVPEGAVLPMGVYWAGVETEGRPFE